MAALVVVALSTTIYIYSAKPTLTLSREELQLRAVSPYHSGLTIYVPIKDAPGVIKPDAVFDVERCTPKALTFGKKPVEIHFRQDERPTGLIPVVAFQVLESGEVANLVLKQRSGIRDKDNAALRWVRETTYNRRPGCGTLESEMGVTIDLIP